MKKKNFLCTKLQHGNQSLHSFYRNWAMLYCREFSAFLVFLINMLIMEEWVILCTYLASPPWGCQRILEVHASFHMWRSDFWSPYHPFEYLTHSYDWFYNFGVSCLLFSLKSGIRVPWGNINMEHIHFLMFRIRLEVGCCFSAGSAINKIPTLSVLLCW